MKIGKEAPDTKRPQREKVIVPLFVVTGEEKAYKALGFYLETLPEFSNLVIGWKDKNQLDGIMLVDRTNRRVGVIICHTEAARDETVQIVKTFLGEV